MKRRSCSWCLLYFAESAAFPNSTQRSSILPIANRLIETPRERYYRPVSALVLQTCVPRMLRSSRSYHI